MCESAFVLAYRSRGIPKVILDRIDQLNFTETVRTKAGDSVIAFDENSFEKMTAPEGGLRLILGKNSGADLSRPLGYDTIKSIVGACVVIDVSRNIELFTDAFNKILLYKLRFDDITLISDSAHYLHSLLDCRPSSDTTQIIHHIVHSIPFGDETIIQGISTLPAHSRIVLESDCSIEDYLPEAFFNSKSEHIIERVDRATEQFQRNIQVVFNTYNKPFLTLTAGNDSRLILATILSQGKSKSFTWGDSNSNEVIVANRLAQMTKSEHTQIDLDDLRAGMVSLFQGGQDINLNHRITGRLKHTFLLNHVMKNAISELGYDVELNGVGSELIRAFYRGRITEMNRTEFYKDRDQSQRLKVLKDCEIFTKSEFENYEEWYAKGIVEDSRTNQLTDEEYSEYIVHEYRFSKAWSPRYVASKSHEIDTVYPFLNLALLEDVYKLPYSNRIKNQLIIKMIRKIDRSMLREPINNINHSIPGKIITKLFGRHPGKTQSTSAVTDELLIYEQVERKGVMMLTQAINEGLTPTTFSPGALYAKLRSDLKSQLVFRVLYSLDYMRRLKVTNNV